LKKHYFFVTLSHILTGPSDQPHKLFRIYLTGNSQYRCRYTVRLYVVKTKTRTVSVANEQYCTTYATAHKMYEWYIDHLMTLYEALWIFEIRYAIGNDRAVNNHKTPDLS